MQKHKLEDDGMTEKLLIVICIIGLLLISPLSAKEVTAKVTDKGLMWVNSRGIVGTLHTSYGEITVSAEDYNNIMVNDTIRYDTDMIDYFWTPFWEVEKVI
ncbi:MAG: hypothetical protein J6B87_07350 [Clostridia bacterium]|nr:hypothetical protein [Clostridia bacterium]